MRGSAVPTMVWSSAASKSASITPMVARTLIRVVSSACGMGFPLLGAYRLDEAQAQMAQLNQFGLLGAVGQGGLDPGGFPPELVDTVAALVGDLGIHGAPVSRIGDAPDQAVALQVVDEPGHGSRGDVKHLGELAHGEAPVWLVVQPHQDLEAALAEAEPVRPALHTRVQLLSQDANGRQRLGARVDAPPLTAQDLPDPRVEEEAIRVGLELGVLVIRLKSELTHIYVPHYYMPQETAQPASVTGSVTGRGRRRPPLFSFRLGFLGDGRPLLVRTGFGLGAS